MDESSGDIRRTFDTDQAVASTRTLGGCAAAFYAELIAGKVPEQTAMLLTNTFIQTYVQHVIGPSAAKTRVTGKS